jgi:glycosyltransferase involved in cell wall biosynthesis
MGVDCDRFTSARRTPARRNALLRQIHGAPSDTVLLYAGRLSPEKNVSLLLDTIERLDPNAFRLCIAGDGPLASAMRQYCDRRNLTNVAFLGYISSRDTLADLFANADAFVHPNPREPFGIAPLEAMSAGIPLIAPNSGGVTSYAGAHNAWLVNPDSAGFALAAQEVRNRAGGYVDKVINARLTASRFQWSIVTSKFLNLCRDLVAITLHSHRMPAIAPLVWSTPGDSWGREIGFGH